MILQVDAASAMPPYEQIREQVVLLVGSGALAEGARLPTIRQLAGDLGVAPGTVARAYRELEADRADRPDRVRQIRPADTRRRIQAGRWGS